MCENFTTISWVLCKLQLILFERVKIGSHKKLEFRLKVTWKSLRFSEAILMSFAMLNNKKTHFVLNNACNSRRLGCRHIEVPGIKLSLVGQCMMFVFECAHRGSTGGGGFFFNSDCL